MNDFLDVLAHDSKETIESGYYEKIAPIQRLRGSLRNAISESKINPIITEIKSASPSVGVIRRNVKPNMIAKAMEKGGAVGISVLTEPKHFNGSLEALAQTREAVKLPILMKDIIIIPEQIEAASQLGADAVLLIEALFERGYCETSVDKMTAFAHAMDLEVLLETHTEEEFKSAIETDADLVGINNRNLETLKIDLDTTKRILEKHRNSGKLVVSESGIKTQEDLRFIRSCGASAFLIGSSIMSTENIEEKVKEFVLAK